MTRFLKCLLKGTVHLLQFRRLISASLASDQAWAESSPAVHCSNAENRQAIQFGIEMVGGSDRR